MQNTSARGILFVATSALLFALSLGIGLVAIPLLALEAGYSEVEIGVLIASAAVAQMTARSFLGYLLKVFPDRTFIVVSSLLIALSSGFLLVSTGLGFFLAAELAQGVARAFFWTGLQTHAIRTANTALSGLALLHIASGVGGLIGPLVAGFLAGFSLNLALAAGSGVGCLTAGIAVFLPRLPVFRNQKHRQRAAWKRPSVRGALWSVVGVGAWKGALNSYIPVALSLAGQPDWAIGLVVSIANGAGLIGSGAASKIHPPRYKTSLLFASIATGMAIAVFGLAAEAVILVSFIALAGGCAAGTLETLSPAVATELVHPEERGDVIASVGLFRAAALLVTPLMMAAVVVTAPIWAAFTVMGGLTAMPVMTLRGLGSGPANKDPADA